jgi:hypothetical protein
MTDENYKPKWETDAAGDKTMNFPPGTYDIDPNGGFIRVSDTEAARRDGEAHAKNERMKAHGRALVKWLKKSHFTKIASLRRCHLADYETFHRGSDEDYDQQWDAANRSFEAYAAEMAKIVAKIPMSIELAECDVCPSKRFLWPGPADNRDGGMRGVCLECGHWCVF